ncbi:MAG: hypothetical protein VYE58_08295 [Pseudomonadota bacterium]|nr:hypothetical protein [Pseudomonadota bacterium]
MVPPTPSAPHRAVHNSANFAGKTVVVLGLDALHTVNARQQQIARPRQVFIDHVLDVFSGGNHDDVCDRFIAKRDRQSCAASREAG